MQAAALTPPLEAGGTGRTPVPLSEWVVVEVADTGPGLAPEVLEQLFQPYFTTKARGTGLGLVVARSIAEEHGGWLDARNAPEGGAVFRLLLPAALVAAHA